MVAYEERVGEGELPEFNEQERENKALAWARQQGFSCAIGGAVNEWRYKPGSNEPVVGATLKVVQVQTGHILWSASGSRSRWAAGTVTGTARTLLDQLVSRIRFE